MPEPRRAPRCWQPTASTSVSTSPGAASFFRLRRPDWAYLEVIALWLSIVVLIAVTAQASGIAALLLAPYLAWVSVATLLNRAIVQLNGPFGRAVPVRDVGSRV